MNWAVKDPILRKQVYQNAFLKKCSEITKNLVIYDKIFSSRIINSARKGFAASLNDRC